jgi:hypothetical protein
VIGGDEVAADCEREREHAAGLDVVGVVDEFADQSAEILHAAVVDASQTSRDRPVAPGPVSHREVDRK